MASQQALPTLYGDQSMVKEKSLSNSSDSATQDSDKMHDRLAIINSQITELQPSHSIKPLKVLVIGNNRDFLVKVRNFLKLHHMKAMTVVDGLTALTLFHNYDFDVVVTTISTTRLNGNIIAQYINNELMPIPVIALTDSPTTEDHHFDATLELPLQYDTLLEEIRRHTSINSLHAKNINN